MKVRVVMTVEVDPAEYRRLEGLDGRDGLADVREHIRGCAVAAVDKWYEGAWPVRSGQEAEHG